MDKIYDPIQKRFLKLNSKKGLKTLQKYIKNFNGGFIRELHPDIASGNICFPYTRVRQHSDVTDCSLIALSLIGLPLEDAVRIFNRQKKPDGLSEDEILGIINKYETRKRIKSFSQINKWKFKMSLDSIIKEKKDFDDDFCHILHRGVIHLFRYLQPMQITIADYDSGDSGHAYVLARGIDSYNIICVQSFNFSDNQYIFSFKGDINDIYALSRSDLWKYISNPFYQTALEIRKRELRSRSRSRSRSKMFDIGEMNTYISSANKDGREIFKAEKQSTAEGRVTRTGPRTRRISGQSISMTRTPPVVATATNSLPETLGRADKLECRKCRDKTWCDFFSEFFSELLMPTRRNPRDQRNPRNPRRSYSTRTFLTKSNRTKPY